LCVHEKNITKWYYTKKKITKIEEKYYGQQIKNIFLQKNKKIFLTKNII
jgi:hypothetical protein